MENNGVGNADLWGAIEELGVIGARITTAFGFKTKDDFEFFMRKFGSEKGELTHRDFPGHFITLSPDRDTAVITHGESGRFVPICVIAGCKFKPLHDESFVCGAHDPTKNDETFQGEVPSMSTFQPAISHNRNLETLNMSANVSVGEPIAGTSKNAPISSKAEPTIGKMHHLLVIKESDFYSSEKISTHGKRKVQLEQRSSPAKKRLIHPVGARKLALSESGRKSNAAACQLGVKEFFSAQQRKRVAENVDSDEDFRQESIKHAKRVKIQYPTSSDEEETDIMVEEGGNGCLGQIEEPENLCEMFSDMQTDSNEVNVPNTTEPSAPIVSPFVFKLKPPKEQEDETIIMRK